MSHIETVSQGLAEIFSLPLIRLTVSNPRLGAEYKKITGRLTELRGESVLQLEKFTEKQAFHENLPLSEAVSTLENLLSCYGQLDATCQGALFCMKISKKGKLFFQRQEAKTVLARPAEHNRKKQYILTEGMIVPPLVDLGVLTEDGRVVKAKYDKFKQINRFLEFLDDLLAKDGRDVIRIIDFGCGKSYLTFIVYYYITEILRRKAEITGLDLKADVIEHCNQVAQKYGYQDLHFFCGDIKDYAAPQAPDMVITLHACDTATDYALFHAMEWGARYILSVPCCQHELNLQMKGCALPPVSDYGILKERFCALATDAVRAKLLESQGYDVQVLEFIDLSHSPKNLLIRAKKGRLSAEKREKARKEAEAILQDIGCRQTLLELLGGASPSAAKMPELHIRRTLPEDIPEVMALYDIGRQTMRDTGNTAQWVNGYPHLEMVERDVLLGNGFVCEVDGRLQAAWALIWGDDPTYAVIDGAWLDDRPYGTIHRIASRGEIPGLGAACIRWCLDLCGSIRIDTHETNLPMRHTLDKLGFTYCGEILCDDGTPRRAYQKNR